MKKVCLMALMVLMTVALVSCKKEKRALTADFEDLGLKAESYWVGTQNGETYFYSGDFAFSHKYEYDAEYGYGWWNQFVYSNVTATDFKDYTEDQYRNVVGKGAENTATFAVVHDGGDNGTPRIKVNSPLAPDGVTMDYVYITNASYAVDAMENGNSFSGEPFKQGDSLLLEIRGVASETEGGDVAKINFYLADYRSQNAADHYIVKDWRKVDLRPLGKVKMLTFRLISSRANQYGELLPTYFCLDQLRSVEVEVEK